MKLQQVSMASYVGIYLFGHMRIGASLKNDFMKHKKSLRQL